MTAYQGKPMFEGIKTNPSKKAGERKDRKHCRYCNRKLKPYDEPSRCLNREMCKKNMSKPKKVRRVKCWVLWDLVRNKPAEFEEGLGVSRIRDDIQEIAEKTFYSDKTNAYSVLPATLEIEA